MRNHLDLPSGLLFGLAFALCACSSAPESVPSGNTEEPMRVEPARRLSSIEVLGKELFFDKALSNPKGEACASCHAPKAGWTGPLTKINEQGAVYPGAVHTRFGNRKPPSAAYAHRSFPLRLDGELFAGGMFWDGRATGAYLGDPLAEQAMGPFLNPVEQNLPSALALCEKVASANYSELYHLAWGSGPDCSTPQGVGETYERVARSIAAYEGSTEVSPYHAKYDRFLLGKGRLNRQELAGLALFNGKGKCVNCHSGSEFTDYTYDNLGVPKNPENPFYRMDGVFIEGSPINPEGSAWVDPGLGGFLAHQSNTHWQSLAAENMGKHKVPTLRNVALAPNPPFIKAYMHNGAFKSLEEVVHFYNTRDLPNAGWPQPEVAQNVNHSELGNLGLSPSEEASLVAFMRTLSDE